MQAECAHKDFRWIDSADSYECASCLRPLPPASNVCEACQEPLDNHFLTGSAQPLLSERARNLHARS